MSFPASSADAAAMELVREDLLRAEHCLFDVLAHTVCVTERDIDAIRAAALMCKHLRPQLGIVIQE